MVCCSIDLLYLIPQAKGKGGVRVKKKKQTVVKDHNDSEDYSDIDEEDERDYRKGWIHLSL